jgi:hypothetical protein
MKTQHLPAGQCSNGHDVYVTRDIDGEFDGGSGSVDIVQPLPDGKTNKPIIIGCKACVELIEKIAIRHRKDE